MSSIFKYLGPDVSDKVFSPNGSITIRCSLPRDFNDPFELFLTTDYEIEPSLLAAYAEAVGELPQFPTTCFSASPIVTPMWAHYARNHEGFVIELSRAAIKDSLPNLSIEAVTYAESPTTDFTDLLKRVLYIAKPRYTLMLQRAVLAAAYFTKASCWRYEEEVRLVAPHEMVRLHDNIMLLDIPPSGLKSVICGAKASEALRQRLKQISADLECSYFEMRIGRSSAVPFLTDHDGRPHHFEGEAIAPCRTYCSSCKEPTRSGNTKCSWCQIDERMAWNAASRNPFRLLDRAGLLENYIKGKL